MTLFHFAPTAGWMNDPNGLIRHNGRHHLFFQHNPQTLHHERVGWGHASSADLISWQQHPDVLLPGAGGTEYDWDGCWSGCAVVDEDVVTFVYTGLRGDDQLPCLARAVDSSLTQFAKDPKNPVIAEPPMADATGFRDHTLLRTAEGWRHFIGGGTRSLGGAIFEYRGTRLDEWAFTQVVLDSTRSSIPGVIWECPDLFAVDGVDVLIVSIVHSEAENSTPTVWYTTGELTATAFTATHEALLDHGDRLYAPQSYWTDDGRRIMFGWIRTELDPAVDGHASRGAMTLPRELTVSGDRLRQSPGRELLELRGAPQRVTLDPSEPASIELRRPLPAFELLVDRAVESIELCNDDTGARFTLDGSALPAADGAADAAAMTVFFDEGILEAFRDGKAATWTQLSLATVTSVRVTPRPGAGHVSATLWPLEPPRRD
jgi:beta-fructofuranosidase